MILWICVSTVIVHTCKAMQLKCCSQNAICLFANIFRCYAKLTVCSITKEFHCSKLFGNCLMHFVFCVLQHGYKTSKLWSLCIIDRESIYQHTLMWLFLSPSSGLQAIVLSRNYIRNYCAEWKCHFNRTIMQWKNSTVRLKMTGHCVLKTSSTVYSQNHSWGDLMTGQGHPV